ncbi:cysteine-rich CWC family protein [Pseudomonas sp.]|uniref:cysteine-rich CWC family protein n=1 Tax=Pseudomonas sp. TaxID=306 RepID=UPI003569F6C3
MNTSQCPCCGQRNQCAQAESATPVSECWCFGAAIDPAVLDSLPPEQRNRACLCPRCAQGLLPSTTPAAAD